MAQKGIVYLDHKGHFFSSATDATISDLAAVLGQIGEWESLAPGLARQMFAHRSEIEELFAEHDAMMDGQTAHTDLSGNFGSNVSKLLGRSGG